MGGLLEGKIALVTGATSGIGIVTAERLAAMGATVIVGGRREDRLSMAISRVTAAGGPAPEPALADFEHLDAVRALGREVVARHERLDILVNNAGLISDRRRITPDGNEVTFQVDHLAHFVLTHELLPALLSAPAARVVTISSHAHEAAGGIAFEDLTAARHYAPFETYAQAKLANVLFAYELARRLAGTGVTSNAVHPGNVRTRFGQGHSWFAAGWKLIQPFLLSAERGAETQLYVASSPEVEGVTGRYFVNCRPRPSSEVSNDPDLARLLWDVSARLTGMTAEALPIPELEPAGVA